MFQTLQKFLKKHLIKLKSSSEERFLPYRVKDINTIFKKIRLQDSISLEEQSKLKIENMVSILMALMEYDPNYKKSSVNTLSKKGGIWTSIEIENQYLSAWKNNKNEFLNKFRWNTHVFSGESIAAYEFDDATPILDDHVLRYIKLISPLPNKCIFTLPPVMGEVGWNIEGMPVNIDTSYYQEKISIMYTLGVIDWLEVHSPLKKSILEIGGGFGALAYHFTRHNENITYANIDLTQSLFYFLTYLLGSTTNIPIKIFVGNLSLPVSLDQTLILRDLNDAKNYARLIIAIPNFLVDQIPSSYEVDLAINIQSLSEMSSDQAKQYGHLLKQLLGKKGLFYEQNGNHAEHGGCDTDTILREIFSNTFYLDELKVVQLVNYYKDPHNIGGIDLGPAVLRANYSFYEDLKKIREQLPMDYLIKSFEPVTRFMSRLTMSLPNYNAKSLNPEQQKTETPIGWEAKETHTKALGDIGVFSNGTRW